MRTHLPPAVHREPFPTEADRRQCLRAVRFTVLIMASLMTLGTGVGSFWTVQARARREAPVAAGPMLPVAAVTNGRNIFMTTCAACHNQDGKGMPGSGKDLTASAFVASTANKALREFLAVGRPNVKPVGMPARGGNGALTDADLADAVAYIRGLQDPRRMPELPAYVFTVAAATESEKAAALAAAGGDAELAEFIAHGSKIFAGTCVACHGKDARGLPQKGKNLVSSEFCRKSTEDDLLAFIKKGRDPSDPANTTGVGMPPKGGNPALSEDDILDVISYVRSLQAAADKTQ